jgi:tetratricopeptide (TPR) repeat protein
MLDCWPLRRLSPRAILEKVPQFVISGVFVLIGFIAYLRTANLVMPTKVPLARTLLVPCHNLALYLHKIIWPVAFSSPYPFPEPFGVSNPMVLTGLIVTAALVVALLISLRWTPAWLVGLLFFVVALSPTMNVVRFSTMIASDKYAYLPVIGLLLPITWLLVKLWNAVAQGKWGRPAILIAVAVLAGLEAGLTRSHLGYWRNSVTLFGHAVELYPEVDLFHWGLGNALMGANRPDEAIRCYEAALKLNPGYADAHHNLGALLVRQGRVDEGIRHYEEALRLNPDFAVAHYNLGKVLHAQGRDAEAIEHYRQALRIKPGFAEAHSNLGGLLIKQGKLDEAVLHCAEAARLKPGLVHARKNLAAALAAQGKVDQAIEQYRQLLEHLPPDADLYCKLGDLLNRQGKAEEASAAYRQALKTDPAYSPARSRLEGASDGHGPR